jgi:GH35 family endo-1,4-beta-xylanase
MQLRNLSVPKKGITLNLQHMDIIDIVSSKSIQELTLRIQRIKQLPNAIMNDIINKNKDDLEKAKIELVSTYKAELLSDIINQNSLLVKERIVKHLSEIVLKGYDKNLYPMYIDKINKLVEMERIEQTTKFINKNFPENIANQIYQVISDFMPVEKDGIRMTSYDSFVKLSNELKNYNLFNLDDIIKYKSYVNLNGTFNRNKFRRALDFARERNATVRLNALIFYMDTPEEVNSLKLNQKNKKYVFSLLMKYIDDIIDVIKNYQEENDTVIVDTIEVLNEPLIRFQNGYDGFYCPRSYVHRYRLATKRKWLTSDNLAPGWLRFLDMEDICKIYEHIKNELPEVNLMVNECFLERRKKHQAFMHYVVDYMIEYEQKHNTCIFDSIGTQMHLHAEEPICEIEDSLERFIFTDKKIEITELDVYVDIQTIRVTTKKDLNDYKVYYMDSLFELFEKYKQLISGITIWSISDYMNFMIKKVNESLMNDDRHEREKRPYVSNIYGGYYDEYMNERNYK